MIETQVDTIAKGLAAWKQIREADSHFEDWVRIGRALEIGRAEAMREAHSNQPAGRGYVTAFSAWLDKNGFGDMNKVTRSHLASCMDRLVDIRTWRDTIGDRKQRLNHPSTVWRNFMAATRAPKLKALPKIARPQDELHAAKEQIRRMGGGSNIDQDNDTIPDQAKMVAAGLMTPRRREEFMVQFRKEDKRLREIEKLGAARRTELREPVTVKTAEAPPAAE